MILAFLSLTKNVSAAFPLLVTKLNLNKFSSLFKYQDFKNLTLIDTHDELLLIAI